MSDQGWIKYPWFCFFKLFFAKLTSNWSNGESRKASVSSAILIRLRIQWYCCKSGMAIFAWRITWNYAYSPFKHIFRDDCTAFIKPFFLLSQFHTVFFSSWRSKLALQYTTKLNLGIVREEFQVVFTIVSFIAYPVYIIWILGECNL